MLDLILNVRKTLSLQTIAEVNHDFPKQA
jgi:hypothetical protein